MKRVKTEYICDICGKVCKLDEPDYIEHFEALPVQYHADYFPDEPIIRLVDADICRKCQYEITKVHAYLKETKDNKRSYSLELLHDLEVEEEENNERKEEKSN